MENQQLVSVSDPLHLVSLSGGKDSQATAIICLERHGPERTRLLFADTGNEHPVTLEHIEYLRQALGPVITIRADFTEDLARKKRFVLEKWPGMGVPQETVERAAAALVPSGNPFLDLCLWKGRFPSRKAQFCTQFLKRDPLNDYQADRVLEGYAVEVWQGIRRDESTWRSNALEREQAAEGWWVNRPIVEWTAQQTVDFSVARGIKLNPLYSQGFKRVGCAPCINADKNEIRLWALRYPEVIDRIERWEAAVGEASKRGGSSFFPAPTSDSRGELRGNIRQNVDWSMTSHGGRQYDWTRLEEPSVCESAYGLCE